MSTQDNKQNCMNCRYYENEICMNETVNLFMKGYDVECFEPDKNFGCNQFELKKFKLPKKASNQCITVSEELYRKVDEHINKTDPVTSCQNPCDKVSHERHIEYDKVSHEEQEFNEFWICPDCKYFEWDMDVNCVCCHPENYQAEYKTACKGFILK